MDLEPDGAGTRLRVTHDRLPDVATREGHREGWEGCLEGLRAFLGAA